jgi:hypothetical protein
MFHDAPRVTKSRREHRNGLGLARRSSGGVGGRGGVLNESFRSWEVLNDSFKTFAGALPPDVMNDSFMTSPHPRQQTEGD